MKTIDGVWSCKCVSPVLKGYPQLELAGPIVVYCDTCGTSKWVPAEYVRGPKPTLRLVKA